MTSEELSRQCAQIVFEKGAEDVMILDLRDLTDIADFFIIASANSRIHLKALTEAVEEFLDEYKVKPYHTEGLTGLSWVLVDTYDVIIHLFLPEVRRYYDIEGYWGDAPIMLISAEHEVAQEVQSE